MPLKVAILGRPNVGKSTLFNRLVGRRLAIVDDTPGVTRDRRSGEARLGGASFTVTDTAGLEEAELASLAGRMQAQTERALAEADLALLLIDARAGITPVDEHFAAWLRRSRKPLLLVANKSEGRAGEAGALEAYSLGLGEPIAISAEHGEGLADLFQALRPFLDAAESADEAAEAAEAALDQAAPTAPEGEDDEDGEEAPRVLQLAIVGRPNVGKSTLVNRLLGEERLLTGPEAGITRDSIAVDWEYRGRAVRLVDTAGLRRRARIEDKLEKLSTADTLRTVRFAHVVVLVLDAADMLEKQDLTIARMVLEEGRALVVAANKWDAVSEKREALQRLKDRLEASLPQARGVPTVTISARTGRNLDALLDAVLAAYESWNRRVATAELNRWLAGVSQSHPLPLVEGRRLRIRYMTQVKARPPTFALFVSKPKEIPDSYLRYLANSLRETFGLPGVPLRFVLRKGKNPYAE